MSKITSRESRLALRPKGLPTAENFSLAQVELEPPKEGQVLVRNLYMSVDPYMRGRMNDRKSYVPPFELGKPLEGGAVGEVIESQASQFKPGDIVTSNIGWREAGRSHLCFGGGRRGRQCGRSTRQASRVPGDRVCRLGREAQVFARGVWI